VYTPAANAQAVVEYVITLICDALRPRRPVTPGSDPAAWERLRVDGTAPREMCECRLGILGLGRIGGGVARVARAIGFDVVYHDLLEIPPEARHGARAVPPPEVFSANVVTLHVDGRPENRRLVGAALLARIPDDGVLVNTSRGFVVDNPSLVRHLTLRPGTRAILDVHTPEPLPADHPLLALPNAACYPHLASRTARAVREMGWVVRDVMAVLEGRPPQCPAPHGGDRAGPG
jgi:phosphoglycerate dehydrogenase-like enzyme